MGKEALVWSHCDPQQCWVELWALWRNGGIKTQLHHQHGYIERVDGQEKDQEFPTAEVNWPRRRTSVQWGLASAAS